MGTPKPEPARVRMQQGRSGVTRIKVSRLLFDSDAARGNNCAMLVRCSFELAVASLNHPYSTQPNRSFEPISLRHLRGLRAVAHCRYQSSSSDSNFRAAFFEQWDFRAAIEQLLAAWRPRESEVLPPHGFRAVIPH